MRIPATYCIPNFSVHTYMIIVQPPAQLLERFKRLQHKWKSVFNMQDNQLQSGYLLLCRFSLPATQEEKLQRKLHYAAMECAPYRIKLDGFFGYPEYAFGLKIVNPDTLKHIQRHIQIHLSGIRFPGERPYYNPFPAIGLASRLEAEKYREVWPTIAEKSFSGNFTADHILVLRKMAHAKGWSRINQFSFENLPIMSRQGVLFA